MMNSMPSRVHSRIDLATLRLLGRIQNHASNVALEMERAIDDIDNDDARALGNFCIVPIVLFLLTPQGAVFSYHQACEGDKNSPRAIGVFLRT
jgi:hypothetical protein